MQPTTRRNFLLLGASATALGVGALATLGYLRGHAPEVTGLQILSPHQFRTFAQLANVQIPRGGPFPQGAADFDLPRLFDQFLRDQPEKEQRDVGIALNLLELGPVLFEQNAQTFSHLPPTQQLTHWTNWGLASQDFRRETFWAFNRFIGMAFYDNPQVWPHLGYAGPSFGQK